MFISQERRGPAIRPWELARVLSRNHRVTVLVPNQDHPIHPDFAVRACAPGNATDEVFASVLAEHEVIVMQGPALQIYPRLAETLAGGRHYLVADLYDPITLEQLDIDMDGQIGRWLHLEYTALLNEQLRLGDFFLCASEWQRDYWLGALSALGRLNHDTWDGSEFRRLIDVVPFGLPGESPPTGTPPVLKGVVHPIKPSDRVILWGGGLWDWLDPLTPVQAMEQVVARQPQARLVFFRLANGSTAMSERARQLASALGLLDRHVLFTPWLPPEQWAACLLEADVGLSFHQAGIETHFAFRTRLLDYIWAGLPIIAASGDVLSKRVQSHGLGHLVRPGDVDGLADALVSLLDEADARSSRRDAFRRLAAQLTWDRVAEPLVHYCSQPWRAGDADSGFTRRWLAAQHDRVLSEAAHAARERAEAEAHVRALENQATAPSGNAGHLQQQLSELAQELQRSEERFQAAMSGRVMRLMTTVQRGWRRLRDRLAGRLPDS